MLRIRRQSPGAKRGFSLQLRQLLRPAIHMKLALALEGIVENVLYGPGRTNVDASLFKDFTFTEQSKLQFRAEFFNVINHPQFGEPTERFSIWCRSDYEHRGDPLQIQLALRLIFYDGSAAVRAGKIIC